MSGGYYFFALEMFVCYSFFSTLSFFGRVIVDEGFCCEGFMWCADSVSRFTSLHPLVCPFRRIGTRQQSAAADVRVVCARGCCEVP